jgi:hypothetical protein
MIKVRIARKAALNAEIKWKYNGSDGDRSVDHRRRVLERTPGASRYKVDVVLVEKEAAWLGSTKTNMCIVCQGDTWSFAPNITEQLVWTACLSWSHFVRNSMCPSRKSENLPSSVIMKS